MDDDVNDGSITNDSITNDSITNGNDAGGHDDASGQRAEERNRAAASVATRAKDRWTPAEGLELRLASPLPSSAFWGADPTIVKHPQCR